jgi:hypothetical protein
MVALPAAVAVTNPLLPAALLTSTIAVPEETQVAEVVISWAVPSEKTPVAVRCALVLLASEELGGVMTIEVSTGGVIVMIADPETPPKLATTVALPTPVPVTRPLVGAVLLTIATDGFDEPQFTKAVRSSVVPLEKFPVAMS